MSNKVKEVGINYKCQLKTSIIILLTTIFLILFQYLMFSKGIWNPIKDTLYIDSANNIEVFVDESLSLDISRKLIPFYAKVGELKWQIEDSNIISFNDKGILVALNVGQTKLWVKSSEMEKDITVMVKPIINIIQPEIKIKLKVGEEYKLNTKIDIYPKNAEIPIIKYELEPSNNVIEVSPQGMIKALNPGETDILISSGDKKSLVNVSVNPEIIVKKFTVDYPEKTVFVGDEFNLKYNIEIEPEGAKAPPINYKIINPIVRLKIMENGSIKALSSGRNVLEVSCGDKIIFVKVNIKNNA